MNKKARSLAYCFVAVIILLLLKRIPFNQFFELWTQDSDLSKWMGNTVANFLMFGLACWTISVKKYWQVAGISSPRTYSAWSYFLLIPFFFLFSLNGIVNAGDLLSGVSISRLTVFTLYMLSIALVEEFLFRGFIQSELLATFKNKRLAILCGAILFGLAHISNFFREDVGLQSVINQVFFAGSLGLLMGALLYKTRNIWPIVVYHFLLDFFSSLIALKPADEVVEASVESASGGDYPIASIIVTYVFYSIPGMVGWFLLMSTEKDGHHRD